MLSADTLFNSTFAPADQDRLWQAVVDYYCCDEQTLCDQFIALCQQPAQAPALAERWITAVRETEQDHFSVSHLMASLGLNSDEGIALLSLAEALLRVPDSTTATALIEDKLDQLELSHLLPNGKEHSLLHNTALWGLALSRELVKNSTQPGHLIQSLWQRLGKSTVLTAVRTAMLQLGRQFVFAADIQEALDQRCDYDSNRTAFSFDMLGEAAICQQDVDYYFQAYLEAIQAVGAQSDENCSVSIKLSALHPRLENSKLEDIQKKLMHRLLQLLVTARQLDVAITIDAEESERLELSLLIFEQLLRSELGSGWGKLGLAVQAYSKRALPVLRWLETLAADITTPIPVRLVKGAYWDQEIKQAQQTGLPDYPVLTRKAATDLSYLVCSQFLLSPQSSYLQPQFATHNALTIAHIISLNSNKTYEFQRLHGMAPELYDQVQQDHSLQKDYSPRCRIYAPVGDYQRLLPYLVRRLLENGANSSFMFQLHQPELDLKNLLKTPQRRYSELAPPLPKPDTIYLPQRQNSQGEPLGSLSHWEQWQATLTRHMGRRWSSQPLVAGEICEGENLTPVYAGFNTSQLIGYQSTVSAPLLKQAISSAEHFVPQWRATSLEERCDYLLRYAQILEQHREELICLCMLEAGKTLPDAIDELREAVDFCYYYATQAKQTLAEEPLVSITGEENLLRYQGRGIFVCISPWNFPLAILTGQIAAALVSGNCVLAKPASRCTLLAFRAIELWYKAELPTLALQFLPYPGSLHSAALLGDTRISGVAFTGSVATAQMINQQLAQRQGGAIATLIAETGGLNAMIADSTTLPEQLIRDVLRSAFNSAGQRCSALRVLYLQEDIASEVTDKLIGAMQQLVVGSPLECATDIGPVISQEAMDQLFGHIESCRVKDQILYELELSDSHNRGYFVPPTLIRLQSMDELAGEVFGPVLHLISYPADQLERVIQEINRSGYGLTLGIHSRNDHFVEQLCAQAEVGNIYINRDQVGAIVAAQPFGGTGLSGTGPKAGGPNYLKRFVWEQTLTRNLTAAGGNTTLLSGD